jgi:hypothetical protein
MLGWFNLASIEVRDFTARRCAATVRAADLRGCGLVSRPGRVPDPQAMV